MSNDLLETVIQAHGGLEHPVARVPRISVLAYISKH
ncbi:MAG: hypothetical protein QOD50_1340 [Actinomycetota bacterium]|nr:hypothetical protein [Actinomycetota bacterium]